MITAWVLTFWVGGIYGGLVAIPGIASEQACYELRDTLAKEYRDQINVTYGIRDGKCTTYSRIN